MIKYRKRIKLFPGIILNISTSGISFTLGGKGISLNLSKIPEYRVQDYMTEKNLK